MSTRCVTIFRQRSIDRYKKERTEELVRFYRHCDGYMEAHGVDLADAILESGENEHPSSQWAQKVLARLFSKDIHLMLESRETEHGDIEFLYIVELVNDWASRSSRIEVSVYKVEFDTAYERVQSYTEPIFAGNVQDLLLED